MISKYLNKIRLYLFLLTIFLFYGASVYSDSSSGLSDVKDDLLKIIKGSVISDPYKDRILLSLESNYKTKWVHNVNDMDDEGCASEYTQFLQLKLSWELDQLISLIERNEFEDRQMRVKEQWNEVMQEALHLLEPSFRNETYELWLSEEAKAENYFTDNLLNPYSYTPLSDESLQAVLTEVMTLADSLTEEEIQHLQVVELMNTVIQAWHKQKILDWPEPVNEAYRTFREVYDRVMMARKEENDVKAITNMIFYTTEHFYDMLSCYLDLFFFARSEHQQADAVYQGEVVIEEKGKLPIQYFCRFGEIGEIRFLHVYEQTPLTASDEHLHTKASFNQFLLIERSSDYHYEYVDKHGVLQTHSIELDDQGLAFFDSTKKNPYEILERALPMYESITHALTASQQVTNDAFQLTTKQAIHEIQRMDDGQFERIHFIDEQGVVRLAIRSQDKPSFMQKRIEINPAPCWFSSDKVKFEFEKDGIRKKFDVRAVLPLYLGGREATISLLADDGSQVYYQCEMPAKLTIASATFQAGDLSSLTMSSAFDPRCFDSIAASIRANHRCQTVQSYQLN